MWLSPRVFSILEVSKDSVDALREELSVAKAEREILKSKLATSENHFEWLRQRVNVLEVERAQLLEKAYNIKTIIPEIVKTSPIPLELNSTLFDDMGDEQAKKLGLPTYNL